MRAISTFSLEAGISTFWCRALAALRIRASMSATGSVNLIVCFSSSHPFAPRSAENLQRLASNLGRWSLVVRRWQPTTLNSPTCLLSRWSLRHLSSPTTTNDQGPLFYQDDFETPGISPRNASPRKHRRQMPNLRRYARGRPQILQRLCLRDENFGFLASFTRFAVVATSLLAPSLLP